jgi:hypothetical protein
MDGLIRTLFKTFITSIILSIAVNCTYYYIGQRAKGYDTSHVIPLIITGGFFINVIILIMTLPSLFLTFPHLWNSKIVRLLLYFSGPVVFIITVLNISWKEGDSEVYLLTGVVFLIVHTFFYYRLTKKQA